MQKQQVGVLWPIDILTFQNSIRDLLKSVTTSGILLEHFHKERERERENMLPNCVVFLCLLFDLCSKYKLRV